MPVVQGARATHTTLECRDVPRTLAFYRDVLGLQVNQIGALVGHMWASNGVYTAVLQSGQPAQQPFLNFYARPLPRAADVDAAHAAIERVREAHGIREVTAPAREDARKFGVATYGFYLNDLDGNWWRVEENEGPFGPAVLPPRGDSTSIVAPGPISYVVLESVKLARTARFYRDFLGMAVREPAPHYAFCTSTTGCVNVIAVEVGEALVPQKVNNHHGFTLDGGAEIIDELRRAALDSADSFEIRKVLPATRQHGSYAFYMQDADTNCWELEVWDGGVSPVDQHLALKAKGGAS